MAQQADDASRYSRDRYHARALDEHGEPLTDGMGGQGNAGGASSRSYDASRVQAPAREESAAAYSRGNAQSRYGSRKRHASRGGASAGSRAAGAAAAIRPGRVAGFALRVVGVALAALLVAAIVWYVQLTNTLQESEDVSGSVVAETAGEPYYVLLLGSDSRSEDGSTSRADSIMLVRVDEAEQLVTIISLPRDLLVDIEGYGSGKLNATFAYNGISGCIDAVSELAGVEISYYASVYFSGFEDLVDSLGGVTVEVPEGTYYDGVWVEAGDAVEINGEEALVLARCRHGNPPDEGAYAAGDYQRTLNQRNLMKAIVRKIMERPVWTLPGSVLSVAECVETNMSASKLAQLAVAMSGMDADSMYLASAPASSSYIGGVSYEVLDNDEWADMMARVEAGEDPNG